MKETLLTVIIPIYNAESFLNERLDSFLSQTDQRFKVVLIDDGSTDDSSKIANEYVLKYPKKFEYYKQSNGGPGAARNAGLKHVDTKYVMFSDADDFNANRTIENIYKIIEFFEEDKDFVIFNPIIFDMTTNSYERWYDGDFLKDILHGEMYFNPKDYPILLETEANICRFIWSVEYLRRIGFKFLEHTKWEDLPAHFYLIHNATKAAFMDYEGAFYYRTNSGNQITSGNEKTRLDMRFIFDEISKYFNDLSWTDVEKIHMMGYLSNFLYWSLNVIEDLYRKEFVEICHNFYKKIPSRLYRKFFLKSKVCLRNKIMTRYLKSEKLYVKLEDRREIARLMKIFNRVKRIFKK